MSRDEVEVEVDKAPDLFWDCVVDRDDLWPDIVGARDRLADAARGARWYEVFGILDDGIGERPPDSLTVNSARVGGRSGWAPLHQAAFHGADEDIVDEMITRGAWRSLRSTSGESPADVADRRGHRRLATRLRIAPEHRASRLSDLETYLAALIANRTRVLGKSLRMPQLGPLVEVPRAGVWCSVPGMYGGFAYRWLDPAEQRILDVESWSRVVGGSRQRHHISGDQVILVEEGFV